MAVCEYRDYGLNLENRTKTLTDLALASVCRREEVAETHGECAVAKIAGFVSLIIRERLNPLRDS